MEDVVDWNTCAGGRGWGMVELELVRWVNWGVGNDEVVALELPCIVVADMLFGQWSRSLQDGMPAVKQGSASCKRCMSRKTSRQDSLVLIESGSSQKMRESRGCRAYFVVTPGILRLVYLNLQTHLFQTKVCFMSYMRV